MVGPERHSVLLGVCVIKVQYLVDLVHQNSLFLRQALTQVFLNHIFFVYVDAINWCLVNFYGLSDLSDPVK